MMDFNQRENKTKHKCIDFSVATDKHGMRVVKLIWEAKITFIINDNDN